MNFTLETKVIVYYSSVFSGVRGECFIRNSNFGRSAFASCMDSSKSDFHKKSQKNSYKNRPRRLLLNTSYIWIIVFIAIISVGSLVVLIDVLVYDRILVKRKGTMPDSFFSDCDLKFEFLVTFLYISKFVNQQRRPFI